MASSLTLYNKILQYILDGTIIPGTDTIKVALVTSAYTPALTHDVLADVLSSPSPEVEAIASPSNGYTQGGSALSGVAISFTDSPALAKFDATDLTFAALTATFRYGILYAAKSVGSPAIVNPLIGYMLFNTTPADIVMSGMDFVIQWNAAGIITQERAA